MALDPYEFRLAVVAVAEAGTVRLPALAGDQRATAGATTKRGAAQVLAFHVSFGALELSYARA